MFLDYSWEVVMDIEEYGDQDTVLDGNIQASEKK